MEVTRGILPQPASNEQKRTEKNIRKPPWVRRSISSGRNFQNAPTTVSPTLSSIPSRERVFV